MKVLLAIDDSPWSEAVLNAAISRIPVNGNTVVVVHVVTFLSHHHDHYIHGPIPELRQIEKNHLAAGEEFVARAAESLAAAGFPVTTRVVDGDPRIQIPQVAAAEKAGLIIMGSQGSGAAGKFLLGSVAEAVMRHATCSVEIVRRPGEKHGWL